MKKSLLLVSLVILFSLVLAACSGGGNGITPMAPGTGGTGTPGVGPGMSTTQTPGTGTPTAPGSGTSP